MTYEPNLLRTSAGAAPTAAGPAALRRANLSLVLRELRDHESLSRADIADATGLHRATVSNLMAELLERRLVREVGVEHVGAIGRPRRAVALHGAHVGALGLEINVDYIAVHGTDLSGRVLVERRVAFDTMGSGTDRAVRRLGLVAKEAAEAMERARAVPAGVAVAVPGLVDVARGVVTLAPNLYWHDLPLADELTSMLRPLDVPVRVDNDANLSALAEFTSGVAAGTPDLVYLTGEVGVGGGIISGGRLLCGADGYSGEVGHLRVDPNGDQCGCGRVGCWETKVGLAALVRAAMPEQAYGLPGMPVPDPDERVADIARGLSSGDRRMTQAVAQVGQWLGLGGSILANLFNPRVIVIGGYFASLAQWLLPHAQDQLNRLVVAGSGAQCRFVASTLGFGAASRGAASMVVDQIIADPTSILDSLPRPAVH
ncbi:ROK family transcriptional regulator [Microbispora triticiradicis]|uniref:ROK family transcriptional regulator n=1 Tax=Microbispora triticiradicis TaxID=2200763 RepID=UPI001AD730F4|nr:ROK family transcriptional regulator [Microbispora triticiradicis]MBO4274246.1 ROK family protein [Microbispora triticiradicis]